MARHPVQGVLVADRQGNALLSVGGGTVWTSKTGGTQLTDLVDNTRAGATDGFLYTDAFGEIDCQYPDDGTSAAWIDFGFGRFYVQATDLSTRVVALESGSAGSLTAAQFGVTPGGVPGPLSGSGTLPVNQLPVGVLGGAATTDGSGRIPETQLPLSVPWIIQYPPGGPWPTRVDPASGSPVNSLRTTIWKGPVDPTFNAGYALAQVDVWLQET